jgi:hypothetical protein
MSEADKDAIVDRYTRGQSLNFIEFATGHTRRVVKAVLEERGVRMRPTKVRNRAWDYRGGYGA